MAKPLHLTFDEAESFEFTAIPLQHRCKIYGVHYALLSDGRGGDLYVTRYGHAYLETLRFDKWFSKRRYLTHGERLSKGTGAVYHVEVADRSSLSHGLVVKFSRMAQEVPLHIERTFPSEVSRQVIAEAHFNDPFREFGLLIDLRNGHFGPRGLHVSTALPLAIYAPDVHYPTWQLGRDRTLMRQQNKALHRHQVSGVDVELEYDREYIVLFGWLEGEDAEWMYLNGYISEAEMHALAVRVNRELELKGFRVLDNKPRHFILRLDDTGRVMRQGDALMYGLIDFELLQRTEAYEAFLKQREHTLGAITGA